MFRSLGRTLTRAATPGLILPAAAGASVVPGTFASTTDPTSQAIVGAVIVAVFIALALDKAHRVLIVLGAVAFLWLVSYLTPWRLISFEASQRHLDLNVILLLASMMAIVGVLKSTGIFAWGVARLLQASGGRPVVLMQLLIWFTALVSAVADNVTTVIFTTPMALLVARATRVAGLALLVPMVMAANIGGTATLIGDPPNILIGSGAGLAFGQFIQHLAIPVLCMMALLDWYTRRFYRSEYAGAVSQLDPATIEVPRIQNRQLLRWSGWILALVFVGFFTHPLTGMPAAVPAAIGAAALLTVQDVLYLRHRDASMSERIHGILQVIEREIEWPTLSFFALLFIVVGAAVETGLIDTLSHGLAGIIAWGQTTGGLSERGTLVLAALLILWMSGVLSALIDNIPYVAVVIPIVGNLVARLAGDTQVLWWALAFGACLGGNGSMVGASANVTVVGLAERNGASITFRQFTAFGARVMALTLVVSSAFLAGQIALGWLTPQLAGAGLLILLLAARLAWRWRRGVAIPPPAR